MQQPPDDHARETPGTTEDVPWFHYARIAAVYLVVLIHCASEYMATNADASPWGALTLDALARCSVPLLTVVSGGLLLTSHYAAQPMPRFYIRRASRVLIPLLFWAAFYTAVRMTLFKAPQTWRESLALVLEGRPSIHLWFLYMLLGLYAVAPFLARLLVALTRQQVRLLMAFAFAAMVLLWASGIDEQLWWPLWWLNYLGYFLLGYYMRYLARWSPPIPLAGAVIVAATALMVLGVQYDSRWWSYLSPLVLAHTWAVASLLQRSGARSCPRWLKTVSATTFGVYLLHPFLMAVVRNLLRLGALPEWVTAIYLPLYSLALFAMSLLIVLLIQRLPLLKRIV